MRRAQAGADNSTIPSQSSPPTKESLPNVSERVPQPSSDLFGNDDLLVGSPPAGIGVKHQNQEPDMFSSGNFSSTAKSKDDDDIFGQNSKSKPKPVESENDDLFNSLPSKNMKNTTKSTILDNYDDDDIFSTKPAKSKPKPSILDADDDIFGSITSSKVPKNEITNKVNNNFTNDDDNIFGSTTVSKPTIAQTNNVDDLFGSTDTTTLKASEGIIFLYI